MNVHHVYRLWQACVYFGREATVEFFAPPVVDSSTRGISSSGTDDNLSPGAGGTLSLCLSALLDIVDNGAMASILLDIVGLFTRRATHNSFAATHSFGAVTRLGAHRDGVCPLSINDVFMVPTFSFHVWPSSFISS